MASSWFAAHPEVDSFDINPVLLGLDGRMIAVDARIATTASTVTAGTAAAGTAGTAGTTQHEIGSVVQ